MKASQRWGTWDYFLLQKSRQELDVGVRWGGGAGAEQGRWGEGEGTDLGRGLGFKVKWAPW